MKQQMVKIVLGVILISSIAQAKSRRSQGFENPVDMVTGVAQQSAGDDSEIVRLITQRKGANFVQGTGMQVIRLLPDDTQGRAHQKWLVRLSNGAQMQAVYNLDLCQRVPLQINDLVGMGGELIITKGGALLHWLHYDPKKNRPDGFVSLNSNVYCGSK